MGFCNVIIAELTSCFFYMSICWNMINNICFSCAKAPVIVQSSPVGCVCVGISCLTCAHHALFVMPWAVSPLSTCLCSTILLLLYHLLILALSGHPLLQTCICMLPLTFAYSIRLDVMMHDEKAMHMLFSDDFEPAFSDYLIPKLSINWSLENDCGCKFILPKILSLQPSSNSCYSSSVYCI